MVPEYEEEEEVEVEVGKEVVFEAGKGVVIEVVLEIGLFSESFLRCLDKV